MPGRIKTLVFTAVLLLALPAAVIPHAEAAPAVPQALARELEQELELEYFEKHWRQLEQEVEEYMPGLHWRSLLDSLQAGEEGLSPAAVFNGLLRFFIGELLLNINLMGQLLVLAALAAFLKNLQSAFHNEQVAALTGGIVLIVLVGISLRTFTAALQVAGGALDNMVDFTLAILPTLLALLTAQGSVALSSMLHPLVIFGVNLFSTMTRTVIFPLIFLSTILALASHFSPHFNVGKLSGLLKEIGVWGMGLSMTVFTGILAVQGVAGTVADAVSLRTAKYMTGALVPVVGKMLSDTVETVASASLVLKNGIYLAGLVMVLLIACFPLLKVTAMIIIFKLSAALVQPLGETSLGDCINTMGNSLTLVFAALSSVAVLFIIAVSIVVGAGNITVMFR